MKKVTVLGMNIREDGSCRYPNRETAYGNLLDCPYVPVREMLAKEGFLCCPETELPPEKADYVFCADLTPQLWDRIREIPSNIPKILFCCDSPIFTRLNHLVFQVLMNPVWDVIVTWNRAYEADYIIHYDIPVSYQKNENLPLQEMADPLLGTSPGTAVSDCRHGDHLGMVAMREDLYRILAKKGIIDLYGKNLKSNPRKHIFREPENRLQFLENYPFALVIENYWALGYVTENLPDCILAGIPAIYWGDSATAQRRFPNTFIPLEEISLSGFLAARKQLLERYAELRENVLKCREESNHWCDSYLNAVRKCFLRVRG